MKYLAGALAVLVAIPGLAHAAGNLNGTYTIHLTDVCQSVEKEVFKPQTEIQTIDPGKIQDTVGYVTFTPTKAGATSGAVSVTFTQAKGSLTILGLPGPPASPAVPDMKIATQSQTGTYSINVAAGLGPSTFNLTLGKGTLAFTAYVSQLSGGVYSHLELIEIESNVGSSPSCANVGSIQHM